MRRPLARSLSVVALLAAWIASQPIATSLAGGGAPTRAQARAFIDAVNLTAADVPGFKTSSKAGKEHESAAEEQLGKRVSRCAQPASTKALAEASSKEFERESSAGAQSVQSGVTIAQSSALAAKELAVVRSRRARTCVAHYFDLLLKGKQYRGATFSPVSISESTPPAPGASGSYAWRISVSITMNKIRIPFYVDILGFVYGPAEVSLFTAGIPVPFPATEEAHLFSLLLQRAKTHRI